MENKCQNNIRYPNKETIKVDMLADNIKIVVGCTNWCGNLQIYKLPETMDKTRFHENQGNHCSYHSMTEPDILLLYHNVEGVEKLIMKLVEMRQAMIENTVYKNQRKLGKPEMGEILRDIVDRATNKD